MNEEIEVRGNVSMIPEGWQKQPLERVAFVQTGIAKGPKKLREPVELPYLRVANVQDGYLDLSHIKTIRIEESKIGRYKLEKGDVLLTEGGDFDKLGRGSVWQGEIENCLHQNHIFVVRPNIEIIMSEFLSLLTGSSYGKAYFLSCSKQSTNLASINSTQLKEFPVILPPLEEQNRIADMLSTWDSAIEKTERLIEAKEKYSRWLQKKLISNRNPEFQKSTLADVSSIAKKQKIESVKSLRPLTVRLHCKGIEANTRDVQIILSKKGRPYYVRNPSYPRKVDTLLN